jgi:hypothetical protein
VIDEDTPVKDPYADNKAGIFALSPQKGPLLVLIIFGLYFGAIELFIHLGYYKEEKQKKLTLYEGLPDYWSALKEMDVRRTMGRELYYKEKYGIHTYFEDSFEKLQNAKRVSVENLIQGVPTYRPLDNYAYRQVI